MKNKKLLSLALATLMMIGLFAGCSAGTLDIHEIQSQEGAIIDLSLEMVPLSASPAVSTMLMPVASAKLEKKNDRAIIDYSNTADGYVMVRWLDTKTTRPLRVAIKGPVNENQYVYTLNKDSKFEVFPLSDGNGKYTIMVCEQTEGAKFAIICSQVTEVKLKDEFAPFIRPNQYVNYNKDSKVVAKAVELMKDKKELNDKIAVVYEYVVNNLSYDKELAQNVKSGYLPDVDAVMAKGKGICFDYAAVMAAMLRSQGIPTRLVVGYAPKVLHAWLDVYSEDKGWISATIYFDGESWKLMDPTYESTSNNSSEFRNFVGDGNNYTVKYLY